MPNLTVATALPPVYIQITSQQQIALSQHLEHACREICSEKMPYQLAACSAEILAEHLTAENLANLKLFQKTGASPFVLVKGLVTTTNLPPTPLDDSVPEKNSWKLQAAALLGILKLCGFNPASFQDEMGGRLYHMVMPAQNSLKSFIRSTKPLNLHTEVVNGYFHEEEIEFGAPLSPGAFGLMCFRNPDNIPTNVFPIKNILDKLGNDTLHELMKKNFIVRSQSSFDREIVLENVPVFLLLSNGLLGMRYSHSKLAGQNTAANEALSTLKLIIEESELTSLVLQAGDILIVNNRICLHGRAKISTSEQMNGLQRWLVRVYGYDNASMQKINFDSSRSYAMIVNK